MLPHMTKPLPDYDRPPVVETVLGVQFEPLPKMCNAHLGAFWKTLPAEWDSVQDAPLIEPQFESFTDVPNWGAIKFKLSRDLSSRVQVRNAEKDRMLQLQNGRFLVNWLGHGGKRYPRYRQVRKAFDTELDRFSSFVSDAGLGEVRPNQWEVTYVNRIPKGTVWESPDDWHFFRPLREFASPNQIRLESFGGEWHFEIIDRQGRLHVQFRHVRAKDASTAEAIILNLTARGAVGTDENQLSLSDGFDLGHEIIVTNFRALMSDTANKYWGLKHGDR